MSGGGYHVVAVLALDEAAGTVTVGDLRPTPDVVEAGQLGRARARIARDRNRLAWAIGGAPLDVESAVRSGLAATVGALRNPRSSSFGIGALSRLADRLTASTGRDARAVVFPRGRRLWFALRSMYEYVETYRTGGGLMRPMFARGLAEAARLTGDRRLDGVAARYAELGERWTAFAVAALPAEVELFDATRRALDRLAERDAAGAAVDELAGTWRRLDELGDAADIEFPLSDGAVEELLADLAGRLREIAVVESAALDELERIAGG
jgi:hypothetical protein